MCPQRTNTLNGHDFFLKGETCRRFLAASIGDVYTENTVRTLCCFYLPDAILRSKSFPPVVPKRFRRRHHTNLDRPKAPFASRRRLTARESEVLFWIGRAKSNGEIAALLNIKPATVGKHLEHIYPKLGVENRTAAASFAFEQGSSETGSHLNI
ncbi:MAG TPA: helix-turn-helix transcriptional regulator [Chthoniobacterales bacterium]|nr:helix-turn-helix transcriptional regulator [Chthoniobacterales bacterium]